MERAEVEFDSADDRKAFVEKCEDPEFLLKCMKKYERWRKGVGEYGWTDPKDRLPIPFCAQALSLVIDSAIYIVERYCIIRSQFNGKNSSSV